MYNFLVFVTWTVTSFLCHQFGKSYLDLSLEILVQQGKGGNSVITQLGWRLLVAVILTTVQITFCALFVTLRSNETSVRTKETTVKWCHLLATLATNISMAMIASSSTFSIKMLEPVTSAAVQYFQTGLTPSPLSLFSLPWIVLGAIVFTGNPITTSLTTSGILVAFASNISLGFRNVELKKMAPTTITTTGSPNKCSSSSPIILRYRKAVIPVVTIPALLWLCRHLYALDPATNTLAHAIENVWISGVFHVTYSFVSTSLVLSQISVLSHAVANIMKRLLVVILLYAAGQRAATLWNFMGLVICTTGLLLFAWDKSRRTQSERSKPRFYEGILPSYSGVARGLRGIVVSLGAVCCLVFVSVDTPFRRSDLDIHSNSHDKLQARNFNGYASLNMMSDMRTDSELNKRFGLQRFLQPKTDNSSELASPIDPGVGKSLKYDEGDNGNINLISQKLTSTFQVIEEAQRLHVNVIGNEIKKYKYAFLIDIPNHGNKGDLAITFGEILFLERMNIEVKHYCSESYCSKKWLEKASELAKQYSPDELVILCQGGGNMISYSNVDKVRFDVLALFSGFKIVVFPESIWIKNWKNPHVKVASREYCCRPNLTIVIRDPLSFSYAKKLFNGSTRLLFAPDIAFHIGHNPRFMPPVYDIMWLKRPDRETPGYDLPKRVPGNWTVHASDWTAFKTPWTGSVLKNNYYGTIMGFYFLQRGRVVITDRLHGHILCVLMDIPHVLIDNEAKKLSTYHNTWTKSLNNTVLADNPSQALDLAIDLLQRFNDVLPPKAPYLDIKEDLSVQRSNTVDISHP